MEPISIRTATVGDHAALLDVRRRASLSNEGDRAVLLANPEVLELDPAPLARGRTRVAVRAGHIVGFATASGEVGFELEGLFVDPPAMRTGIGRALVDDVIRSARACGATRIDVVANDHALAFYEALGFVTDGMVEVRFGVAPRMHLDVPDVPAGRGAPA